MLFTLGEALAVLLADDGLPLAEATRFRRVVAGSEVNVAAGFVALGHRATVVTAVGDDALGDGVTTCLHEWGIDVRSRVTREPTGVIVREPGLATRGESMHLRQGSAATTLDASDVDRAWPGEAPDAVLVTGITAVRSPGCHAAVRRAVARAREVGALVVVDPNLRPALADRETYAAALAGLADVTDVAVGDADELAVLAGTGEDAAVASLLDRGCRLVVTKRGADGVWASDRSGTVHVPSRAAVVVDSVGAGDAFTAGLLAAHLEGATLLRAAECGTATAAAVVAVLGDVVDSPNARRPATRGAS